MEDLYVSPGNIFAAWVWGCPCTPEGVLFSLKHYWICNYDIENAWSLCRLERQRCWERSLESLCSSGIGSRLLEVQLVSYWQYFSTPRAEHCDTIQTTSLSRSCLDWNKPSIEFYKRMGAVDLTEKEGWLSFRLKKSEMDAFCAGKWRLPEYQNFHVSLKAT